MGTPLIIVGAGGHARECAWLASEVGGYTLVAFATTAAPDRPQIDGTPVLSLDAAVARFPGVAFVCGIGDSAARRRTVADAVSRNLRPVTLVHPQARVAPDARLGSGVMVFAGSIVSVAVILHDHVHVNFDSSISHDCVLEAYATVSPGVRIAGNVLVGEGALLGIGASVRNGRPGAPLRIGARAVVGAGACVVRDVSDAAVVVGVPARPLPYAVVRSPA